jgi:hypothetical protein
MTKHNGACNFEQAKRGDFKVCTRFGCKERFPCAGNDCGHSDCVETRGELPKCHYCLKRVDGAKGDTWTSWAIHGLTRAAHYTCRSQHASPVERVRWGELSQ